LRIDCNPAVRSAPNGEEALKLFEQEWCAPMFVVEHFPHALFSGAARITGSADERSKPVCLLPQTHDTPLNVRVPEIRKC
jgi:hypothetical protein